MPRSRAGPSCLQVALSVSAEQAGGVAAVPQVAV